MQDGGRNLWNLVGDGGELRVVSEEHVNHFRVIVVRRQMQRSLSVLYTAYTPHDNNGPLQAPPLATPLTARWTRLVSVPAVI